MALQETYMPGTPVMKKQRQPGMPPMRYTVFPVEGGWVAVLASIKGLKRLILPQSTPERALEALGKLDNAVESPEPFSELIKRLQDYYSGKQVDFPDILDLSGYSPFQCGIWKATRTIPRGETRSYAWVAELAGCPRGARAAGQALGKNPLPPIVPCHRVLTSGGKLGGFTGGLKVKEHLLKLEKANARR
jgi:methylated-DNA-[protein]-cysteine S-methyltransferase